MTINSGDTAWVLASAALVLLMTPGLALFYGGMVRAKSVLNMMMMSFGAMAHDQRRLDPLGLQRGVRQLLARPRREPLPALRALRAAWATRPFGAKGDMIPALAFVAFQAVFAIITVALISGAIADRAKFSTWMVFTVVWATIVYFPVANWVFAFDGFAADKGGWIANQLEGDRLRRWHGGAHQRRCRRARARAGPRQAGRLRQGAHAPAQPDPGHDRRRPAVVRLVRLQRRLRARRQRHRRPHLGQHPRSHRRRGPAWLAHPERIRDGHATSLGAASGVVAGLVAITPACSSVTPDRRPRRRHPRRRAAAPWPWG